VSGPWQPESEFSYSKPIRIPDPVPGCTVCAGYVTQHRSANRAGDPSAAVDARVLMRRHLENQHQRR
jgi:hypothetical protein